MTMFTAEGLIRAYIRGTLRGICSPSGVVHHALLRWLKTQGKRPSTDVCEVGLVQEPRLHARRAPGLTCLAALVAAGSFGDPAKNSSKGCGTIMRVAPIAFVPGVDRPALARDTSALTHGHLAGQEAAAAFVTILETYSGTGNLDLAVHQAVEGCRCPETRAAMHRAMTARRDGLAETVEGLGGGWTAEEALSIALYAALCARDLDHGLQIALTHSGDSDSTGAIAGNLLGLIFPDQVVSHPLIEKVECADLIERLARDLAVLEDMDEDQADAWFDRYPGW